mmetsp:Transcript_13444/g.23611  ORF Transcript_13444/g.23611 Transcript_13444/m.23611 type:complete len:183 (-) Transcript_13444:78-626(-)
MCNKRRGCVCDIVLHFKRCKDSGIVDFGAYSFDGTHSRTCFVANNPKLDPDDYPWDGKPEQAETLYAEELEDEDDMNNPEENDDENADPNVQRSNKVRVVEKDTTPKAVDVSEEMKRRCDDLAEGNLSLRPAAIWELVRAEMDKKYVAWFGCKKNYITDRVRRTRSELNIQGEDNPKDSASA